MAETKDFSSALEEMKQKAPEIYDSFIRWYGPGDLQALSSNEAVFNDFAAQFNAEVEKREKAEQILNNAVNDDLAAAAAGTAAEETGEDAADGEELEERGQEPGMDVGVVPIETEAMLSDPFRWEDFYAPAPEVETTRFNEAYELLNSEAGRNLQQQEVWKNNSIRIDGSDDKSLEEALNLSACRRLASSDLEINLDTLNDARREERARIEVEYYNNLYAVALGDKYNNIKGETHLERILKIDQAVRAGKTEKEIFKMLAINPNDAAKKMALATTTQANVKPIADFMEKRSKFSRGMHGFGKAMDWCQKFESKNPLFGLGMNFVAAGNPVYMGYRSILSARALYNDFQGFKDYAAFKEVFKDQVAEHGLKLYLEQNADSKVTLHDYNQVRAYPDYAAYVEKHPKADNRLAEEEFALLKKFQRKSEFTRESFESARQFAGQPYAAYAKAVGDKAVSEDMFNNVVKYTDIRRAYNYEEYKKKAGDRAVSETEYRQVKALNQSLGKVSIARALRDKKTFNDMANHSVIFFRSLPVIGQTYALGMAAKNMVSKTYWKGLAAKAKGTGKAIQTLWNKKGRDKEAWKQLYSNGSGLIAETVGAYMLYGGVSHSVDSVMHDGTGTTINYPVDETKETQATQAATDTITAPVAETPSFFSRIQSFMGYGNQEVTAPAENIAADSTGVEKTVTVLEDVNTPNRFREWENIRGNPTFSLINPDGTFRGFGFDYAAAAADSATVDDVQIPTEQHTADENGDQTVVEPVVQTAFEPTEVQQRNLSDLFEQYPRAATIILEGTENPSVDDVTKGSFKLEGEGNLYKRGVITSSTLQDLYDQGKLSSAQVESLVKFADSHFKDGQPIGDDAAALLKEATERSRQENTTGEVKQGEQNTGEGDRHGDDTNGTGEKTVTGDGDQKVGNDDKTSIQGYSFDENGRVIYRMELGDLNNMDPEQMDARIYQDLQTRLANGEQLDGNALKFMEQYKEAHPEQTTGEKTVADETVKKQPENEEKTETTAQTGIEKDTDFKLTRHDFESGKGYEMSGTGRMNGKNVEVVNLYDSNEKMVSSQITVLQDDTHSTVIKTTLDRHGRPQTLVTEIDGDHFKTHRASSASAALQEVLKADHTSSDNEGGRGTAGLQQSQKIELQDGDENTGSKHRGGDELYETTTPEVVEHKVWSTTFKGRYWIENDSEGNPQLQYRIADRQSLNIDRGLLDTFQSTIRSHGDTSHDFSALGGALRADNFGSQNPTNPEASGIMIKCEYLAERISLNEAVYHDMDVRVGKGDTLSDQDMQWRRNYEQDLAGLGLVREDGRLSYNPEAASQIAGRTEVLRQGSEITDQGGSRRFYDLSGEHKDPEVKTGDQTTTTEKTTGETTEKTEKSDEGTVVVASTAVNEPVEIDRGGFKGTYKLIELDDQGSYRLETKGGVTVDQDVLQALRGEKGIQQDADGKYTAANGTIKSGNYSIVSSRTLMEAQKITQNEAIYDHLQEQSGSRELTAAESRFMQAHDRRLTDLGLKHDTNGEIVKANAYEGQPRAAVRRGRGGYGD